jgi:hypothetical protein
VRARGAGGPDHDEFVVLIARRRAELQDEAFRLGRRVYAESPKRFGARVGRYLDAAARECRAELVA